MRLTITNFLAIVALAIATLSLLISVLSWYYTFYRVVEDFKVCIAQTSFCEKKNRQRPSNVTVNFMLMNAGNRPVTLLNVTYRFYSQSKNSTTNGPTFPINETSQLPIVIRPNETRIVELKYSIDQLCDINKGFGFKIKGLSPLGANLALTARRFIAGFVLESLNANGKKRLIDTGPQFYLDIADDRSLGISQIDQISGYHLVRVF